MEENRRTLSTTDAEKLFSIHQASRNNDLIARPQDIMHKLRTTQSSAQRNPTDLIDIPQDRLTNLL